MDEELLNVTGALIIDCACCPPGHLGERNRERKGKEKRRVFLSTTHHETRKD
jgi:hypothetical protein